MINRENLIDVMKMIDKKDVKGIKNTHKEYIVIHLHIFNVDSYVTIKLTNDYNKYKNISNNGNVILSIEEVSRFLNN